MHEEKGNGRTVEAIQIRKYADGFEPGPEFSDDGTLIRAFSLRSQIYRLEQRVKELKQEAYNILAPNYLMTGASNLFMPDVGGVEVFQGSQSRTDINKFCELLVGKYGVPAGHVAEAKAAATVKTDNKTLTVKFKPVSKGDNA